MPRFNHSEIICVIDSSGSMEETRDESIEGFNQFIDEQKSEDGTADVSVYLFNSVIKKVLNRVEVTRVPRLNRELYRPDGNTALLDALGTAIDETGRMLSATMEAERPEHVIICILTDGRENSSQLYNRGQILNKIMHQTKVYNWKFIFLAANQDAFLEAESLGISKDYTSSYASTKMGTGDGYKKFSKMTGSARKGIVLPDWD